MQILSECSLRMVFANSSNLAEAFIVFNIDVVFWTFD